MNKFTFFFLLCLSANFIASCNLEQEVQIDLPVYESQYVVECYLEPGKPFGLLLTRSVPYFDPFSSDPNEFLEQILVDSAEVTVTYKGQVYMLNNGFYLHSDALKLYNYGSFDLVPEDYDEDFVLDIDLPSGEHYTAHTRLQEPVAFSELVAEKAAEADTLYRFLAHFDDPNPGKEDFFRYTLNVGSLDSIPYHNFALTDRFAEEDELLLGTNYAFTSGDTLIATICHIDQAYYDFFTTIMLAEEANGNPFAQPGGILSNIEGEPPAIGIFTTLNCDRDSLIVP
ncbi:MAG TPA: DUF4249 family protein [Phaeodactylibacter sp.]|nr:DUF4249 family protein [Phaeodactylibacter sp.]